MKAKDFESVRWAKAATDKKLQFFHEMMGKDKKHHDEQLQEVRSNKHSKLRYLKREQDDAEAKKRMAEFLKWKKLYEEDQDDSI